MKNSRIISLLETFSAAEFRRLRDYICSPYFNKHEGVLALFEQLATAYPDFLVSSLHRERLAETLLAAPITQQQLQDITSYLTRLVEGFIAQERWQEQPLLQQEQLVLSLRERQVPQEHQRAYNKWQRMLPLPESAANLGLAYQFEAEGMHTQVLERKRKSAPHLRQTIQAFDDYYFVNRLRYACALLNRKDVLADAAELDWARQLHNLIGQGFQQDASTSLLPIYHQLFSLLDTGQEEGFASLLSLLEAHKQQIEKISLREIYAHLVNFCIKQLNEGNIIYQPRLFGLYQDQLVQGLLLESGQISPADYKNIVSLALRNEAFDWTEAFIEDYKNKLPSKLQAAAYRYQRANLHFHRGEYSACLRLLRTHEFADTFYQLGAKTIVLKLYFETEDFEAFYYAADAFASYLKRNRKIPAYQKELYYNLIRFSKRLAKLYIQHRIGLRSIKKAQLMRFQERLSKHQKIAQSLWILNKTQRLLTEQGLTSDS
ncbi:MAG: hypothetical protein AAF927_16635 [Bacteroidota bacterium]